MRDDAADALAYACQRVIFSADRVTEAFADLARYRYVPDDPALTARPVQGSHRFMDTKREIPAADPDAGYSIRIERAIDALDDAIMTTRTPALTPEQRKRILDILGAV